MKKTRLFLIILAMMASASVSMAQTLITSTQASTTVILPKSGRVKGLVIRPEVGIQMDIDFDHFGFQLNGTVAYQFNPYIAVGGGIGLDRFRKTFKPLFGNFRVYFSDTYVSPYLDLKLGMMNEDFMGSAMLGFQCKCFDIGAAIKYGDYSYHTGYSYYYDEWLLTLNFAYNIQFGKKNK